MYNTEDRWWVFPLILNYFSVEERKRPLKRFTPPRKGLRGGDSETESGSDYSDSEYSDSSYT